MSNSARPNLRVIWFVNKLMPAVCERLGLPPVHRGGWLDALEVALRDADVDLAVVCEAPVSVPPFTVQGTRYYTLAADGPAPWGRVRRAVEARGHKSSDPSRYDSVVADFAPDLVHIHGTEGPFGLSTGRWAVPSVVSIQGVLSSCAVLERRGRDRHAWLTLSPVLFAKATGMGHATRRLQRLARREREVVAACDTFIGRTRFDHDFLMALKPSFSYFHCDELLRAPFLDTVWRPPGNSPRIIACGAGDYARKGLGTALDAVGILRSGAGLDVILRFVGSVPAPESTRALARHARRLGLSTRVQLSGPLDADQVARELRSADLYVHPTHADNSPNSLCEAMAVGVPVVASSAGGKPSLAANETDALLVQDGDAYALAGAIRRVLDDDDLAQRLSRNARSRAHARHEPQRVVAQVLEAYAAISAGAPTAQRPG